MSNEPLENLEELARRAVACKHWRWMPGMRQLVSSNRAPYRVVCDGYAPPEDNAFVMAECGDPEILPDLTDPATIGCLFALVREAHGDPEIVVSKYEYSDGWTIGTQLEWEGIHSLWGSDGSIWGWSEAEVLVRALEVAP